ncbi:phage adaptor protein [Rhizobium leguminosarum]
MSITNYTELKSAISDWMARTDLTGNVADFISLGEARLNRLLGPVGTTATLTGSIGAQTLSISSLSVQEPQNLYYRQGETEYFLVPRPLGTFSTTTIQGSPSIWAIEANTISLDRPMIEAYTFRFVYLGRFALSDAAPTNEFLTNNPDLYLAASIVWGCTYTKDPAIAMWKQALDEFTQEVANENARKKRGQLTVDPALGLIGQNRWSIRTDSTP